MLLSLTNYAYDAAGRMIKEGEKTYEYGWLDKVLKVTENGKTLADFEYHNNGQIAKAIRLDKTENFLWDGLALVKRDDTKFINEPHAGGGNPVLAIQDVDADKSKAIFTDMLGTSLGSTVEDQYNNISKTSFGADTTDTSAFFTGKPYDEDLQAFVFPYRNYDKKSARWRSADPAGYPDGVNGHFYAGALTMGVDVMGTAWGDLNFVEHFYFGNSRAVNLSEAGLSSAVENSAINKGIQSRFGDQILMAAEQTAPTTGDFRQTFANSYNFGDVRFSIGNASMYGFFDGTVSLVETLDNGMALYSYSGNATINFLDTFTDPLSVIEYIYGSSTSPDVPSWLLAVANVGGKPYDIYGSFTWAYKGTFEK